VDGIQFNAGYFSGVASSWGIGFTIWVTGETTDKRFFVLHNTDKEQSNIVVKGDKTIYNMDEG